MLYNFLTHLHRNWTKWTFALITFNILVFIFVLKSQCLTYFFNTQEHRLYMIDSKIQSLNQDMLNEISLNQKFLKNLIKLADKISQDNKGSTRRSKIPSKKMSAGHITPVVTEPVTPSLYNYCSNNVIPILLITCNRPEGMETTLKQLINYRTESKFGADQFPIYISQGCRHKATEDMVKRYKPEIAGTMFYDQNDNVLMSLVKVKRMLGYYKIADHYKQALDWVLRLNNKTHKFELYTNESLLNPDSILIVEDDLNISPDFFHYFLATNSILRTDKTLFCVSAWNDNGKSDLVDVNANSQLYRTDFFPGLGWMMLRSLWIEIRDNWPAAFWDEYLRQPSVRKNRQCIRPEIPRTATFGRKGVSNGQFFDKHLKFLMLNSKAIDFCRTNLSYIESEAGYRTMWQHLVYNNSELYSLDRFLQIASDKLPKYARIEYGSNKQFGEYARKLSLMDDMKSGVQRTAYRGVVTLMYNRCRVFLAPNSSWTHYIDK